MRPATHAFSAAAMTLLFAATASAESLDGAYRGSYVCEKTQATQNILRVPLDVVVTGKDVRFGRPLFNLRGTRVTGTELASGTVDDAGKLHLTSDYVALGFAVHGDMTAPSACTAAPSPARNPGNGRTAVAAAAPVSPPWCRRRARRIRRRHSEQNILGATVFSRGAT